MLQKMLPKKMKIEMKSNILVVSPNKNSELSHDIYVQETDDNKNMVTCTVIQSKNEMYQEGDNIITGKYSLYKLVYKGTDYYFVDVDDVVGTIEENV
ncbi:MAG: hypothetical protein RBT05_02455 [Bacteroidales bacterium]|nr:hypothetical protein [Bacteroidales bacterium]